MTGGGAASLAAGSILAVIAGYAALGRVAGGVVARARRAMLPAAHPELEGASPELRARVGRLLDDLAARGYVYEVLDVWRTSAEQEAAFAAGFSQTHDSLHEHMAGGAPAADAVDLVPVRTPQGPASSESQLADGYVALRDAAPDFGLASGGAWSTSNPRWAAYGLGWDPGHLEIDT